MIITNFVRLYCHCGKFLGCYLQQMPVNVKNLTCFVGSQYIILYRIPSENETDSLVIFLFLRASLIQDVPSLFIFLFPTQTITLDSEIWFTYISRFLQVKLLYNSFSQLVCNTKKAYNLHAFLSFNNKKHYRQPSMNENW